MKKQTAVKWLIKSLEKLEIDLGKGYIALDDYIVNTKYVKEQAKEMEKDQIRHAFNEGWLEGNNPLIFKINFKQYYNETYNK